jgi:uncharacterized membrane protein YgcG
VPDAAPTRAPEAGGAPSPWKRRIVIALLRVASALLFLGWFLGARPAANTKEFAVASMISQLDPISLAQQKAALETTFREYRRASDLGVFLLALALLLAAGAAAAAPVWAALEERRTARAGGGGGEGGGGGGGGGGGT